SLERAMHNLGRDGGRPEREQDALGGQRARRRDGRRGTQGGGFPAARVRIRGQARGLEGHPQGMGEESRQGTRRRRKAAGDARRSYRTKTSHSSALLTNVTTEKLARIMSDDPGGVVAWTDELAGLIGSFDRYGGGGMDRAFWLECYGGRPYRLDRVKDGTIDVPCTAAAVLDSIQPDRLHSLVLSGDNDGFSSR